MRVIAIGRTALEQRHNRLDPPFYLWRQGVGDVVDQEGTDQVSLGDLVAEIQDGARLPSASHGMPILRLTNVRACEIELSGIRYVEPSTGAWPTLQPGDVLFTRAAEPFRAAVVPTTVPVPSTVTPEITVIRVLPAVLPEYLAAILSTSHFSTMLRDLAYRSQAAALPRLRLSDVFRLPIPLPRRSVQEEIRNAYRTAEQLAASAHEELSAVFRAVHAEIDTRIAAVALPGYCFESRESDLSDRWDVSFARGRLLRGAIEKSRVFRPLFDLGRPATSSLRGIDDEDLVLPVQADDINESTFLVEDMAPHRFGELSSRVRQRLALGDVLLCTTGGGQQVAFLDDDLGRQGLPILGSATFTALRFPETPRFFAIALTHPLVRMQLNLLACGSVQRFVNKRDLDSILVSVLGSVWREDFETRIHRAMEHRRESLAARARVISAAEDFIRKGTPA